MNETRAFDPEEELLRRAVAPLVDWYRRERRPLPWREDPTPYRVWISEIMLQQTRIEAALPYYDRFMEALPTVEDLAAVEDDRLMKLWEGLGYYSRARNLKKAARLLVSGFGGQLPRDAAALKGLPGIGDYTAGAIASIAFGLPEPAVDGNVLRVVMRLLASGEDVMQPKTRSRVTALLRAVYPSGEEAALLTQGLMELGERVCLPKGEPQCALCPLGPLCRARAAGETGRYPVREARVRRRTEERTVLLLSCGGKYAIRRREDTGLLAGLWELPGLPGALSGGEAAAWLESQGVSVLSCAPCGEARHIFSHVEWHMRGYALSCARESGPFLWVTPDELRSVYPLPSAFRAYLKQIL